MHVLKNNTLLCFRNFILRTWCNSIPCFPNCVFFLKRGITFSLPSLMTKDGRRGKHDIRLGRLSLFGPMWSLSHLVFGPSSITHFPVCAIKYTLAHWLDHSLTFSSCYGPGLELHSFIS